MSDAVNEKELGEANDVSMDDFLRTLLSQMFENDNDTSTLKAELKGTDGSTSTLEFSMRIVSINGVKTRDDEDDE